MNEKINFYNSLELTLSEAEIIFSSAVDDSKSLFHTPTLSTFENKKISNLELIKILSENIFENSRTIYFPLENEQKIFNPTIYQTKKQNFFVSWCKHSYDLN